MRQDWRAVRSPTSKYVVYEPPVLGLPSLAVLFQPGARPRVFMFETQQEATEFLTTDAIEMPA